jgi:phage shock protein PspC (stress-responsive transcriptional regulator)
MADPSSPTPPQGGGRAALDGLFAALRGMGVQRNRDDRWLAGVCVGIADRLRIDPLVVRGALIVLLFVGGIGGLAYLVAWALLPDRDGRILAEDALHGHGWGIALLVVIGIVVVSDSVDRWWLWLVLVPVGVLAWYAVSSTRAGRTPDELATEMRGRAERFMGPAPTGAYAAAPPAPPAPPTSVSPELVGAPGEPQPAPVQPHGLGPGRSGVVVGPPRAVSQRRRRGGLLALLLAAGLAVAGYGTGTLLAADRSWSGTPELLGGAFALAGAGFALVLVGLAGRRAGFTALLVTVLAGLIVLGTALPHVPSGGFGERTWLASAPPASGFTLTAGEATLSMADAPAGRPVHVEMGAGDLTVHVPAGMTVDVTSTVHLGQLTVKRAGVAQDYHGRGGVDEVTTTRVGPGPTGIPLDILLGAGQVTIVEDAS